MRRLVLLFYLSRAKFGTSSQSMICQAAFLSMYTLFFYKKHISISTFLTIFLEKKHEQCLKSVALVAVLYYFLLIVSGYHMTASHIIQPLFISLFSGLLDLLPQKNRGKFCVSLALVQLAHNLSNGTSDERKYVDCTG